MPSAFELDFDLEDESWDPDFLESNAYPAAKPIRELLERASYSSSFIDSLEGALARIGDTNWSAFILLFRFKCKRKPGTRGKRLPFVFVGAFPYDPDAEPI